jgi:Holliday junction resolvasome RuvABC ATP-dependent DNA helicase subunit
MSDYFDKLIGQENLKRKLGFYLDAFQKTRTVPFLLFAGAKGLGKTQFARTMSKSMQNNDGSTRPLLELNCSVIKNNQAFFENIFLTYINGNKLTVLFDECHNLPKDLAQALLTICNTGDGNVREFRFDQSTFVFDFTQVSFVFATTETDKIFPPLKDRLTVVDFEPYSSSELAEILTLNCPSIVFCGKVLDQIGSTLRGNARSAVRMAEQIGIYASRYEKASFGEKDFLALSKLVSIMPHGVTATELNILRELNKRGPCSLQMLASATGLSRSALQRDHEQFLLMRDYIRIDGKRKITSCGVKVLEECETFLEIIKGA